MSDMIDDDNLEEVLQIRVSNLEKKTVLMWEVDIF